MEPANKPKTGNEKRKESCKQVGGAKKRKGHSVEHIFGNQFGPNVTETYTMDSKPQSDRSMDLTNPRTQALFVALEAKFGPGVKGKLNASVKQGNNLQFVLGRIPEITSTNSTEERLQAMGQRSLWQKYLQKSTSEVPADWLVYQENNTWTIFLMDDAVNYITTQCTWRELATGRLKGDFVVNGKKQQILTYEKRDGKGLFLGANGNKGKPFIHALKASIPFVEYKLEEFTQ